MDRFEVILKKKTIALRKDPKYFIVNSKEKGMTSKISLSEESFDMTARKLRRGIWQSFKTVLVCLCLFTSRTPLEVKRFLLVSIGQPSVVVATFLPKIGAFKLGSRLTHEPLRYISPQGSFPGNRNKFFLFYKDISDFWFVKPDPNMITLSFYKEISNVLSNMQTFAVVVDTVMLCPM